MKVKPRTARKIVVNRSRKSVRSKTISSASIDTSDMPEVTFSKKARRGIFFRPGKESITIRIDKDILDYYRAHAAKGHYQTEINNALREQMKDGAGR